MTKPERDLIMAVYEILGAIPGPVAGSKSATVLGLSLYAKDMLEARWPLQCILFDVVTGDLDSARGRIKELQQWVEARKAAGWQ